MRRPVLSLATLLCVLAAPSISHAQSERVIAIEGGAVFDGTSEQLREGVTILVRGDRIAEVGNAIVIPDGAEVIDLTGWTLLPGLIDLHTHLTSSADDLGDRSRLMMRYPSYAALLGARNARVTLQAGFTTVRDVGGLGTTALGLRDAINAGLVPGPQMITAISMGTTGSHCDPTTGLRPGILDYDELRRYVYDGPEEARAAVRRAVRDGADVIKVCATAGVLSLTDDIGPAQMTSDELEAVVGMATMLGVRTVAHAHGIEGIRNAVRAGITTIDHGSVLDEEVLREMRERGIWLVPTMMAFQAVRDAAAEGRLPPGPTRKTEQISPLVQESHRLAIRLGNPIAFGTDSGVYHHGLNGGEFALMVNAGMRPAQTLIAATRTAAEVLDLTEQLGTLEVGKFADIVAVRGNPLADITLMERVGFVMRSGRIHRIDGEERP